MMTPDECMRLAVLRERLFRCVEDELSKAEVHKSYEGALEVILSFPDIFHRAAPPTWVIRWSCYLVLSKGNERAWHGKTLGEALAIAERDTDTICFPYEMARFEGRIHDDDEPPPHDELPL